MTLLLNCTSGHQQECAFLHINTAMAEVKNISERDTSVLLLFPTLFTPEKITEKLKIRHVISGVSLYQIPLRLVIFAHHQSHSGSGPLLGSSLYHLLSLDPAECIACVLILASRDACLEVGSPFKDSCHWFDRGSFLLHSS